MYRRVVAVVLILCALGMRPDTAGADIFLGYGGGPVLPTSTTYAIFWLPSGSHFEPAGDDSRYENRVHSFLSDVGGTSYYNVLTEYSKDFNGNTVQGGPIRNSSTFAGAAVDTTPYPHAGTTTDPLTSADYQTAVTRAIAANEWAPTSSSIFFLYTADNVQTCDLSGPRSNGPETRPCSFESPTSYPWCGGHSSFSQGSATILYAVVPDVPFSCPGDPAASPIGDARADRAVRATSALLAGAVTDPLGTGWSFGRDPGNDVGTACGGIFPESAAQTVQLHADTFRLGDIWSQSDQRCVPSNPAPPQHPNRSAQYFGGSVMPTTTTYAIFWLPSGSHFEPAENIGGDAHYEFVIERFLKDVGRTSYYNILTQYSKAAGKAIGTGPIQNASTFGGAYLDTTPYPRAGTNDDPLLNVDIQNEVERAMKANGWSPGLDKLYLVFTAHTAVSCGSGPDTPYCTDGQPGHRFCGYHGYMPVDDQPVIFSYLPSAYSYRSICGPVHNPQVLFKASPHRDPYADSQVLVLSHELFESVSDPLLEAWSGGNGEIGDLCEGKTGGKLKADGGDITLHGHRYVVQSIWSNASHSCVLQYPPRPKPPA